MTTASATEGYIIDPAWGRERERLRLLAAFADPWTTGRLEKVGVSAGWHCLDVGAGNGSVAAWLADRVGPQGRSVACDIDTRFLDGVADRGVEVMEHDVLADDFPEASFDLVHTRAVIMHLAEPDRAIARMVRWLRPGGVLLLEEPDGMVAASAVDPLWRRLWDATAAVPAMDVHCGRTLPGRLVAAGLADVTAESWARSVRGGSPYATWYRLTVDAVSGPLEAAGVWSRADIAGVTQRLSDPSFVDFGLEVVSCWGRRT